MDRRGEKVVLGLEFLVEIIEKFAFRRLAQHGIVDLKHGPGIQDLRKRAIIDRRR